MKRNIVALIGILALLAVLPQSVYATPLKQSLKKLPEALFPPTNSWDADGPMLPDLSSLFDTRSIYEIGEITGGPGGTRLSLMLFQERGALADENELRLIRSSGGHEVVFAGNAKPGDLKTITLLEDETYIFSLNNHLGNFSAIPKHSSDSRRHIFAIEAQSPGWLTINAPILSGGTPFTTLIAAGECFVVVEDLPHELSDLDFNDMTFGIVREEPIPEPASLLLLGAGMLGLSFRKRNCS